MLSNNRKHTLTVAFIVSFVTILVYLPALQNGFVWDDLKYISENTHICSFNAGFFRWAFFNFYASNWHPLTWISHALDYAVWGLNPLGHHLTNIVLHAVNTWMVMFLIIRLFRVYRERTKQRGQSPSPDDMAALIAGGAAGVLFGLHPAHVESVAWVAERKDLLCALFFLSSIMSYINYATISESRMLQKGPLSHVLNRQYALSLFFFLLALLSKPMAVTLPVVLLILDWYPLERIRSFTAFWSAFMGKLPFFALSLISSVLTILAQKEGGSMKSLVLAPLPERLLVAMKSLVVYLWKMMLPLDLFPFYPYPKNVSFLSLGYFAAAVLVTGITAICIVIARKRKLWLSVWSYYVITLIPVIGIIQVGEQPMADRYTYLPGLAPTLVISLMIAQGWAVTDRLKKWRLTVRSLTVAISLCILISLPYLTFKQTKIWKDSMTLWSYELQAFPDSAYLAYNNRGLVYRQKGQYDRAIADYTKAVGINPKFDLAYHNRGFAYQAKKEYDRAIADYTEAIEINPKLEKAYINRGYIYRVKGQYDRAIADYTKAIAMNPGLYTVYNNRAIAYEAIRQYDKAIADYTKAVGMNPGLYTVYNNRGLAYEAIKQYDKAIADYTKAIEINPKFESAYSNRSLNYLKISKLNEAEKDIEKALELNPDSLEATMSMVIFYSLTNKNDDACKWLRKAVEKGFNDWNYIKTSSTLDNIRSSSCYKEIIRGN